MIDWEKMVSGPCVAVFGEAVSPTYRPKAGTPFAIVGVFDRAYTEVTLNDDNAPMTTRRPVLGVTLSQFQADPAQGDKVYVPSVGKTYVVNNVEPDGHGWALLRLNELKTGA